MAEIVTIDPTGNTLYFLVTDNSGDYWNGTAFETYNAANIGTYDVTMTEDGAVGIYRGTFPAGIAAGVYEVVVKRRAGGAPAVADIAVGIASYIWDTTTLRVNVDATAISGDSTAADNLELAGDNYSATRGLAGTALPNAAADADGGLPTQGNVVPHQAIRGLLEELVKHIREVG